MLVIMAIIKVQLDTTFTSTNKLLINGCKRLVSLFFFFNIKSLSYTLILKCKGLFHVVSMSRGTRIGSNCIS